MSKEKPSSKSAAGPRNNVASAAGDSDAVWMVVGWLGWFGAIGGILATLSEVTIRDILEKGLSSYGNYSRLLWGIIVGGCWGFGGAISFAVILFLDRKFEDGLIEQPQTKILLAGVGITAGFAGLRILKLVGGRLERQVGEIVDEKAEKLNKLSTRRMKEESKAITTLAEGMAHASGVLAIPESERNADLRRREAIEQLKTAIPDFPTLRGLGIYLGRLYRALQEHEKGIEVLTQFLDARRKENIPLDSDDAKLMANRACYWTILGDKEPDPDKKEQLFAKAWEELKQVLKIDPSLLEWARSDHDLAPLVKSGVRELNKLT